MTRARPASYGVIAPPPLQRWLNAVLMLFVSLVQGLKATLGMGRIHRTRECHTTPMPASLPEAKPDIQLTKDTTIHAVILGLDPRILLEPSQGLATDPLEAKQDSRLKAENDTSSVAAARTSTPPERGRRRAYAVSNIGIQVGGRPHHTHRQDKADHVPHLTCARCMHHAYSSSPVRGRTTAAHA